MRINRCVPVATVLVGLSVAGLSVRAGDPAKGQPDMQQMMEAYARVSAPGAEHHRLDVMVGDWKVQMSFWADPGSEPEVSAATSHIAWIMDGHYLQEDVVAEGDAAGVQFRGRGTYGYDKARKEYVSVWIDTMSTAIPSSVGQWDVAKNALVLTGETTDPLTGQMKKGKYVMTFPAPNKMIGVAYAIEPGGKEVKEMELVYTK